VTSQKIQVSRAVIGLFLGLACYVFMPAADAGASQYDSQYWNNIQFNHALSARVEVKLGMTQKLIHTASQFGLHNYSPGVTVTVSPAFEISAHYKYQRSLNGAIWQREHRLDLVPTIRWDWEKSSGKLDTKVEYRHLENHPFWRFREKVTVDRTMTIHGVELEPFASGEIYYEPGVGALTQARLQVGAATPLTGTMDLEFYLLRKSSRAAPVWLQYNVIGTKISLDL